MFLFSHTHFQHIQIESRIYQTFNLSTNDRHMLHLAAWLNSMDQDKGDAGLDSQPMLCGSTPEAVLEHPLLAPQLDI